MQIDGGGQFGKRMLTSIPGIKTFDSVPKCQARLWEKNERPSIFSPKLDVTVTALPSPNTETFDRSGIDKI